MYCRKCGREVSEQARFCPGCGSEIKSVDGSNFVSQAHNESSNNTQSIKPQTEMKQAPPNHPANANSQSLSAQTIKKYAPWIAVIAVVLIAAVIIVPAYINKSPNIYNPTLDQDAGVPAMPSDPVSAPPETTPAPNYPAPVFSTTSASDVTTAAEGRNYSPYLVQDGRPDTAWSFTGTSNEWIQLSSETEQYVKGIMILNGYTKYSQDYNMWLYYPNNRPKDITITFSDGSAISKTMEDIFDENNYHYQEIPLDSPKLTKFVRITINNAYIGYQWNDTCISEIQVY